MESQMAVANQVVKVVVLSAFSACSAGIAWVAAKRHSNKTISGLEGQIEKLNRTLESVLGTFEVEAKKAEQIMAAIAVHKPATGAQMMKLLKDHKLNAKQIAQVMNTLQKQGFCSAAAA
tara:strand:- start:237 stop:593 length:357 start_codon:yes stop_codon:yes gene_type:complete